MACFDIHQKSSSSCIPARIISRPNNIVVNTPVHIRLPADYTLSSNMSLTPTDGSPRQGVNIDDLSQTLTSLDVTGPGDMEAQDTDLKDDGDMEAEDTDETHDGDMEEHDTDETYGDDMEAEDEDEGYGDGDYTNYAEGAYPGHDHSFMYGSYRPKLEAWLLEDGCLIKVENYRYHYHSDAKGTWNQEKQGWDLEDGCFIQRQENGLPYYGSERPYYDPEPNNNAEANEQPTGSNYKAPEYVTNANGCPVLDENGSPIERNNWPIPVDFTTWYVKPPHRIILADSEGTIRAMLRDILSPARDDPRIIIDLEGNNLGAKGDISLLIIHMEHFNKTYLVDVVTLGKSAFILSIDHVRCSEDTCGVTETVSLKSVLESEKWLKLLWDCRTDSNALYFLYDVDLKGVEDVQLYENLQFTYYWDAYYPEKNYLLGLAKAIERYAGIPPSEKADLTMLKASLKGRYHIFSTRPLSDEAIKYATNDVQHLGPMLDTFAKKLNSQERYMIKIETKNRLDFSHRKDFAGSRYAPEWYRYRGAPDLAWLVQLGWTGEEAVCNGACLEAWGHPHICKETCACYGTCQDWRRKVEEGIRNAERRTFGEGYVGGDMHEAQWNEVRKAERERDQELKMRCDSCTASKGAKNARERSGDGYLPVMDFEKEVTGR